MPFPEAVKERIKDHASYACCVCRQVKVGDIHHIVPQSEGGQDDEDNGVLLCVECHRVYGGNRELRKWIREVRDNWYRVCAGRLGQPPEFLDIFEEKARGLATKDDVQQLAQGMLREMKAVHQATLAEQLSRFDALAAQFAQSRGSESELRVQRVFESKPVELSTVASTAATSVAHSDAVFQALDLDATYSGGTTICWSCRRQTKYDQGRCIRCGALLACDD